VCQKLMEAGKSRDHPIVVDEYLLALDAEKRVFPVSRPSSALTVIDFLWQVVQHKRRPHWTCISGTVFAILIVILLTSSRNINWIVC